MSRLQRLIRNESGVAMIVVMGFMALTIPVVTAALAFASTASNNANVASADTTSSFTAAAASDYAVFKLLHTAGFKETLVAGVPVQEVLPINGEDAVVSWTKRGVPGATTPPEEPTVFSMTKVVDIAVVPADTPTTVTYTIEVSNFSAATATLDEIKDGLPPYFDYVDGTTTGATTANPTSSSHDSGQGGILFRHLVWAMGVELAPAQSLSISFDAIVDAPDGYYCNVAWSNPGGHDTGTGPTAKVQVGAPATTLCDNETVDVRKTVTPEIAASGVATTFTYRIEIENLSAVDQDYFWLIDLLPPGIIFDGGTVVGDITTRNPFSWFVGDQQRLFWLLFGAGTLGPGETKHLEFQATGALDAGTYENQVWVSFDAIGETAYSFPTARITVFDVFDIAITNGQTTSTAQIWVGGDGDYTVTEWEQLQP
jgi:uncharacterized repeat protein (TIGR01451 family)